MKTIRRLLILWLVCLLPSVAYSQLPDFTELVEKQGPAVVNISITQNGKASRNQPQMPGLDEDDPALEFFKRFIPRPPRGAEPDFESRSLGSGFIIGSDGYILTNAHVVDAADEILVRLNDKREYKARVIGADRRTDVALLKIDANNLPAVRLGDPARLKVGEWVLAIGSPFGFENSVTAGIVSAKGRALPQETFIPFIQTDVAINPGNSGGPLFNLRGEVVGINSQIYSRSGGSVGLSFAIPIDVAMEIQSQLRAYGKVQRGRIGVAIQEVTKELAENFGLGKPQGALVGSVEKGGPADKAGVEVGDVVLKFDGKSIPISTDLQRMVAATKPGTKAVIQVWRNRAAKDLTVTVGETPEEKQVKASVPSRKPIAQANKLGLVLTEMTPDMRRELKISGGVMVEEVRGNGRRTDLRAGDIVLAVMLKGVQTEVRNVEQLNQLLAVTDQGLAVSLLVRRGDAQSFVTIKPSR